MRLSKKAIVNQIYKKLLRDKNKIIEIRHRLIDSNYSIYQPTILERRSNGNIIDVIRGPDNPYAEEISIYIKCKEK